MCWRPRSAWSVVVSCVLCLGFWQFGEGAYIPAKAWVAQELMQRAWDRAGEGARQPAPGHGPTPGRSLGFRRSGTTLT